MKYYNNNSGYSIVISLIMVWFLIVVTSWVFNLVLWELNDNRGRENYLKAFAGAEWALELALLQVKDKWYGYYGSSALVVKDEASSPSNLLLKDPSNFKWNRDVLISYDLWSKTKSYSWSLDPLWYAIVPLFILDDSWLPTSATSIKITSTWVSLDRLVWNLLSEDAGISGTREFDENTPGELRVLNSWDFITSWTTIWGFLWSRADKLNYMILFNSDPNSTMSYNFSALQDFTKPETTITSSAQVWKYKQNLETSLDNTEFLNILRYSIYSN